MMDEMVWRGGELGWGFLGMGWGGVLGCLEVCV